jgi:hypothetical protein
MLLHRLYRLYRSRVVGPRRLGVILGACALLVGGLAVSGVAEAATPAAAGQPVTIGLIPDSGGGCVNGPNNNSYTCFYVTGGGLKIDSLSVYTCVKGYAIVVHDEITGPAGNKLGLPVNSDAYPLENSCLPEFEILANSSLNETQGDYCGVGWHDASTGTYLLSKRCVGVHP